MKIKLIFFFCVSFLFGINLLYCQITITEIEKTEERIVLKPTPYDSLKDWEDHESLDDYKQYIGLQIYLPPRSNMALDDWQSSPNNFLFSIKPSIIKTNVKTSHRFKISDMGSGSWKEHIYDSIITFVYKPFQYSYRFGGDVYSEDDDDDKSIVGICSDSNQISNTYFTILNVIYGKRLDSIIMFMRNTIWDLEKQKNKKMFIHKEKFSYSDYSGIPSYIFLLKNNITNDSLYCFDNAEFILVPYFIKQKSLYQDVNLIYDDEKEGATVRNNTLEEFDTRFDVKYEDNNGVEESTGKKVLIEPGSRWYCSNVTLLKPTYNIYYILKNDKDEQVALTKLDGFIEENTYKKREADKKLQYQQLLAKQKQEKLKGEESERILKDKLKTECISLFGQYNGELIALGKVRINMTKDMCKYAWGVPLWTNKTTTEYGIYEDWYYWLGYSLHFENGLLKRIEE